MHQHLKELATILYIAGAYFSTTAFALAAVVPTVAIQGGFIVAALALLVYLFLVLVDQVEQGLAVGLLLILPFTCLVVGVIWWLMRLVGFWQPLN